MLLFIGLLLCSSFLTIPIGHVHPIEDHSKDITNSIINREHILNDLESNIELHNSDPELLYTVDDFDKNITSYASDLETDIETLNRTFVDYFSVQRSHEFNESLKSDIRHNIIKKLKSYHGIQVLTQDFTVRVWRGSRQFKLQGKNIVAILPGKYRNTDNDSITLFGGHYDTVKQCPGVDDNGSGSVTVMELARLSSKQARTEQFKQTLMFVLFDLEEWGAVGSMAFVNHYLVPEELVKLRAKFNGAYITDMVLLYDSAETSQSLPVDISRAVPGSEKWMMGNKFRGDFLSVWSRSPIDMELFTQLETHWIDDSKYKLFPFDPKMPAGPLPANHELWSYQTFLRSDHASFWYHEAKFYNETLKAVLLTDLGNVAPSSGEKA
ncbi:hypothetical protein HDE_12168 [Halotydeus destructor]|nr:hypothetical protein HDE_12168 [Halotydeus destructor]